MVQNAATSVTWKGRATIIVPCYNEAKRLKVDEFERFLAQGHPVRIVFVNDGSRDDTWEVLKRAQERLGCQVELLGLDRNRGKAEAVRTGVMHALRQFEQDYVGYWDADLATPLSTIPDFAGILDARPEIEMVFGSRVKLCGRQIDRQPARHYLGRLFATVVSLMLSLPIYDTQCGAKLFRVTSGTANIFQEPFISKWIFDVEILARYLSHSNPAALAGKIYEFPLEQWTDVAGSKVAPTDFLKAFFETLKIKRRYLS